MIIGAVSPFDQHLLASMRTVRECSWAYKCTCLGWKNIENAPSIINY